MDEIPPGSSKVVPIGRHGVGVYNVNGTFYAIANYCPHEGGPLCSGPPPGRPRGTQSVTAGNERIDFLMMGLGWDPAQRRVFRQREIDLNATALLFGGQQLVDA
ncbi:Rieske 2Fe-2S domain-containing protein, partial [Nocardia carnea]|uniref:Rieske 2Fe-2S domain-containing protein n=1 Tax=Nocardia carnea TaxID=37328 RepID=UPI002453AAF4